jgi:hypothetical protein
VLSEISNEGRDPYELGDCGGRRLVSPERIIVVGIPRYVRDFQKGLRHRTGGLILELLGLIVRRQRIKNGLEPAVHYIS